MISRSAVPRTLLPPSLARLAAAGVADAAQLVGERRGHDAASPPAKDSVGTPLARRSGRDVRARVISSHARTDPSLAVGMGMAWTQPVQGGRS